MKVTLLAGGTGGTKLAHGFALLESAIELSIIANVGDDAEIHGLHVSPDIDALMYTLAGLADPERGWGIKDDTFTAHAMFARYEAPTWFTLGDADLATNVERTRRLREGASLTDATGAMAAALGIRPRILPATDDRLRTVVETDEGELDFQEYFVHRRQEPEVRAVRFDGAESARPSSALLAAIGEAEVVVIGPSNPIVSIGPILALAGVRDAMSTTSARRIAVSPIIGGRALKGPADRMLASLGHGSSAPSVARLYEGLIDRFVLDQTDASLRDEVRGSAVLPTVMRSEADRAALARQLLELEAGSPG
jgi:LPPG:FO 2-phospho-L-lactate transferase